MKISLQDLCKSYGEQQVLRHLTAELAGRVVITGPSGCGKTTLARIMLGLEQPDSGRVTVPGQLVAVFQEDRLCPGLTAFDNVELVCPRGSAAAIERGFAALGLGPEDWNKPCAKLSGGQKRRTAILRAMLAPADGILLDEPFKGLDAEAKRTAMQTVLDLAGDRLLVVITHDPAEAEFFGPQKLNLA